MRGQPVTVLMPERFRGGHDARVTGFLARGGHPSRVAAAPGVCGLRPDGSEFPVELSVSAVATPGGRRITAIIRDMTSYARALQALQDRENRLRMAMESANLGSAEVDLFTGQAVANAQAARVLGLGDDPAGWVLPDFTAPILPEDRPLVQRVFDTIVREDRPLDVEFRVQRRDDGAVRWIYGRGRLFRDAAGHPRRVVGVVMDIDARRRAEEQLLQLSQRLLAAQEDERRAIARELHDQVGQALTAALINLQMLPQMPESAELHATLASVLQQVRELSLNLRPSMLDSLGLEAALSWYLDRQKALGGFEVELACPGRRLPPAIETVMFRLVQEAVTNILRHARARRVSVVVEASAEEAVLSVHDDGVGFDTEAAVARATRGGSLGVLGMTERAQLAGGTLRIESEPGRGTTVVAVLPLRPGPPRGG
jgi:two-component system, NarL family, sensor histidine kinase UhpB